MEAGATVMEVGVTVGVPLSLGSSQASSLEGFVVDAEATAAVALQVSSS